MCSRFRKSSIEAQNQRLIVRTRVIRKRYVSEGDFVEIDQLLFDIGQLVKTQLDQAQKRYSTLEVKT